MMLTDGLLEFGQRLFENPKVLTEVVMRHAPFYKEAVQEFLEGVHTGRGRDSATVICWGHDNTELVAYPSG